MQHEEYSTACLGADARQQHRWTLAHETAFSLANHQSLIGRPQALRAADDIPGFRAGVLVNRSLHGLFRWENGFHVTRRILRRLIQRPRPTACRARATKGVADLTPVKVASSARGLNSAESELQDYGFFSVFYLSSLFATWHGYARRGAELAC